MKRINRRTVLRGVLGGSAVTVALPLLDCFLNDNGTALASGKPMPVRFGTWVWGLGISKAIFNPKATGVGYELPEEIACLKPVQDQFNVFTDYIAYRDSAENICHTSGWVITRAGQAPMQREDRYATFDVAIANRVGRTTRFKMLNVTATGDIRNSLSYEGRNAMNPAESEVIGFYTRLFGPGFNDPNAPTFTPDPEVMVRKSVLSAVMDDVKDVQRGLGAEDRTRLDQYFSGLRDLEHQLNQQLTKPEPIAACHPAAAPKSDFPAGLDTDLMAARHKAMTDLLVMALACDQTRVFNMFYTAAQAITTKKGYEKTHHTCTHEEGIDVTLGYQPMVSWFTRRAMENWLYFVDAFSKMKEGDGTLLDNTLIVAHSDQGLARVHSLDGMAMFTAGRAGGKVKTGIHVSGNGTAAVTQLPYTAMSVMGLDVPSFGTKSNTVAKVISEILV